MKLAGLLMVLFSKKEPQEPTIVAEEQPMRHSEMLRQRRMLQCKNRMKDKV
jgi:hypothetical protein